MTEEQEYAPTLPGLAAMMQDANEGVFVDHVAELLEHIAKQHRQRDKDDSCEACSESWTVPFPCEWWMLGERVAIGWLLERAAGVQRGPLRLPPEIARRVADPLRNHMEPTDEIHRLALEVLGLRDGEPGE